MIDILEWFRKIFGRRKSEVKKVDKTEKIKKMKPRKAVKPKLKKIKVKPKPKKIKVKIKRKISKPAMKRKFRPKIKPPIKKIPQKPIVGKRTITVPKEIITEVIVADIMTRNPILVSTNDTLSYVMRLFTDKKISGAPVVHDENFVGVISDSDIINMMSKKELLEQKTFGLKKLTELKVGEFMHSNPVYVYEYTKLSDATDLMNKHDITRLPVLDDKRKIVGIVTRSDIIRGVAKELLYRILRRKPVEERVRLKIDTDIDEVLKIVDRKGSIDIDDVKKRLLLPEDKIEEWGKILESHNLLELFYPPIGKPKLRKKIK
jgi:CBS domain-containing protein